MSDDQSIAYLVNKLRSFLAGKDIPSGDLSVPDSIKNPKLKELFDLVENAVSKYVLGIKAIKLISEGELNFDIIKDNDPVLEPIAILQSKLKHLLSQIRQIIEEENPIQIDFINELSTSFNSLIEILKNQQSLNKQLAHSKRKFQLIAENSNDVIWTIDIASQRFTYISPSIYNLRGITAEEAMNEDFMLTFMPESAEKAKQNFYLLLSKIKNKKPLSNLLDRIQIFKKDGQIIKVEISYSIIYDENGEPKEILGITRDITARDKAERALKESEEKYRLITENTQDVIWKIDIEKLKYNYISPSIRKLTGQTPDKALQLPLSEVLLPESYQKLLKLLSERLTLPPDPESNIRERFQIYSVQGETVNVEATAKFIRDKNGKAIEILGVSRDISERIEMENALKESEVKLTRLLALQSTKNRQLIRQLQYIYNNAINAIAFFNIHGDTITVSSCNKRWANGIGLEQQELEGLNINELSDSETSLLYRRYIQKVIDQRQPIQEYIYWHNLNLHVIVIPIMDEQTGEISSCGSLVYNISDKVNADIKRRESEERFFSIFNNTKDAIVLLTMDLEITQVNEGFYKMYGSDKYPKTNVLEAYVPPEYHKTIHELILNLNLGLSIPTFECELYNHNRKLIAVEFSTSAITLENTPMILCIIRDISIRKEMERMLTKVGTQIETRERRKLAADLHDNVGPLLSSMNMYLSVLSRKDELQPYSEVLKDVKRILKDTISSVREISNNLSPQVLENFGLTVALNHFFETKKKLLNIQIINTIGDIRFVEIKERMIYNIIIEVFNNSLKYSNASHVKLSLSKENNTINVDYSDNGIGFILKEKMEAVNNNLGLFSIINRVKILDGTYHIDTSPGNGFLIKINFPINNL